MNQDVAFRMGMAHTVCQDYGRCHSNWKGSWVILSDGCSGAPDTDIGARILCCAAEGSIDTLLDLVARIHDEDESFSDIDRTVNSFYNNVINMAIVYAGGYTRIPSGFLSATLAVAVASSGGFLASCCGDGSIFVRSRNKRVVAYESYDYPSGYPYYPCYLNNGSGSRVNVDGIVGKKRGRYGFLELKDPINTEDTSEAISWTTGDVDLFDLVAISTDGISQFSRVACGDTSKETELVPFRDVAMELMGFKTTTGQFVQRRMRRFTEDCSERGWRYPDDISLGAIAL